MASLILESRGERREHRIAGPVLVGRAHGATVQIPDPLLSRRHTRFYAEGGRYWVEDLGSKNGTFLNGSLLKQPEALANGDRIKIGPALLTFRLGPEEIASAPPPRVPSPTPLPPRALARPRAPAKVAPVGPGRAASLALNLFLVLVTGGMAFLAKTLFIWIFRWNP